MGTTYVTLGQVGERGSNGITEIFKSGTLRSETITSSGTTAPGSLAARKNDMAQIFSSTAVYATAGATPVVTTSNGIYCPAGLLTYIAMQEGHKIAVIDV